MNTTKYDNLTFPLIRRIYPKLIAKSLVNVQPMRFPMEYWLCQKCLAIKNLENTAMSNLLKSRTFGASSVVVTSATLCTSCEKCGSEMIKCDTEEDRESYMLKLYIERVEGDLDEVNASM